jgi:hypothetical protein
MVYLKDDIMITLEKKLSSACLSKNDVELIVQKVNNNISLKKRKGRNIFLRNTFTIGSQIKQNGNIYNLEENDVNSFFISISDMLKSTLSNMYLIWRYTYRNFEKHTELARKITINFSKKTSSIHIIGETKKWVDSIYSDIKSIIESKKTNNERKGKILGILLVGLPLTLFVLLFLYFENYRNLIGTIGFFSTFMLLGLQDGVKPFFFPHSKIIVENIPERESKILEFIIQFILGIITGIIGTVLLKLINIF